MSFHLRGTPVSRKAVIDLLCAETSLGLELVEELMETAKDEERGEDARELLLDFNIEYVPDGVLYVDEELGDG